MTTDVMLSKRESCSAEIERRMLQAGIEFSHSPTGQIYTKHKIDFSGKVLEDKDGNKIGLVYFEAISNVFGQTHADSGLRHVYVHLENEWMIHGCNTVAQGAAAAIAYSDKHGANFYKVDGQKDSFKGESLLGKGLFPSIPTAELVNEFYIALVGMTNKGACINSKDGNRAADAIRGLGEDVKPSDLQRAVAQHNIRGSSAPDDIKRLMVRNDSDYSAPDASSILLRANEVVKKHLPNLTEDNEKKLVLYFNFEPNTKQTEKVEKLKELLSSGNITPQITGVFAGVMGKALTAEESEACKKAKKLTAYDAHEQKIIRKYLVNLGVDTVKTRLIHMLQGLIDIVEKLLEKPDFFAEGIPVIVISEFLGAGLSGCPAIRWSDILGKLYPAVIFVVTQA